MYKQNSTQKIGNFTNSFIQTVVLGKNPTKYLLRNRSGSTKKIGSQFKLNQKQQKKEENHKRYDNQIDTFKIYSITENDLKSNYFLKN